MANRFVHDLKMDVIEGDFSIDLLYRCKDIFQYCGGELYNPTVEKFRNLLKYKVKESNINLSDDRINQLVNIIKCGGVLYLKDIVFVDDTAFEIYEPSESMVKYNEFKNKDYITYHYSSDRYVWRSFFELTTYFLPNRFNISEEDLSRLRDEINLIFIKYFNNNGCPSKLGLSYGSDRHVDNFAISSNKEEIENGLLNRTPFNISIIGKDGTGATKLTKLGITCDLSKDPILTVTDVDDKMEFLSDIISKSQKNDKGALTYRNKKTSEN